MENELVLYTAGSLHGALTEGAHAFARRTSIPVRTVFGPSGLLRGRLEAGEHADVFASADMGHPGRLAADGRSGPVVLFARTRVCALAAPGVSVDPHTVLDVLLDDRLVLGTATPITDGNAQAAQ